MLAAAVFVATMIIFMMRTGRKLKGQIEGKLGSLAQEGSHSGIFLFIFLMVLREGVETVLTLTGVSLTSTELMSFLGTLFGVDVGTDGASGRRAGLGVRQYFRDSFCRSIDQNHPSCYIFYN